MRCRSGEFRFRGVNLDQPGTYLHWSIFTISLANVVLIAVLVVIFGAGAGPAVPQGCTYPPTSELPAWADPGTLAGTRIPLAGNWPGMDWQPGFRVPKVAVEHDG
jgi:hypothetical protein